MHELPSDQRAPHLKLAALLRRELEKRGIRTIRESAKALGVSAELARRTLKGDHIPKDKTLIRISRALDLASTVLVLPGHRQQLPGELAEMLLPVAPPASGGGKQQRRWPLSQEQCTYLGRIMRPQEIQLIRKYRQLTPEAKIQLIGFINYTFEACRVPPPEERSERRPAPEHEAA